MAVVTVHSKPGCAFCYRSTELLDDLRIPYAKTMYIPGTPGYEARRDAVFGANGHASFPLIFVGTRFLGGFRELKAAYETGALPGILEAEGVDVSTDCEDDF